MAIDHSLTPGRLVLDAAAAEAQCGCEDHGRFADALSDGLDDRTIRYILETRPHFEDLRHAVGQVAGMLVHPQVRAQEFAEPRQAARLTGADGYFARVGSWLRTSF